MKFQGYLYAALAAATYGTNPIFAKPLYAAGIGMLCKGDNSTGGMGSDAFLIGFLCVMASSLSYAIYLVGLNKTRIRTIASLPVTFYVLVFGSLIYVVRILCGVPLVLPYNLEMWLCCLGLGLFPTVISLVMTSRAIQCIGSTQTALLGALEPVTAVVLGILVLGETLTLREIIGMILIFVSVSLVVKRRG